jgi:hypothetical protein
MTSSCLNKDLMVEFAKRANKTVKKVNLSRSCVGS